MTHPQTSPSLSPSFVLARSGVCAARNLCLWFAGSLVAWFTAFSAMSGVQHFQHRF